MTVEEKLVKIAENTPKVYEAGKAEGIAEGKQAEWSAFWDIFQNYGNRIHYVVAFAYGADGYGWTDKTYNPKYPITGKTYGLQEAFRNNGVLTDTKVPLRLLGNNLKTTFNSCSKLKRIPLLSIEVVLTEISNPFGGCSELEELNIECVGDGCIAGAGFSVRPCTKLNKASHISIINALSKTTTGLTVSMSLTAVNKAFETAEGAADGSTSAEWLALVATRSNWTVSLG